MFYIDLIFNDFIIFKLKTVFAFEFTINAGFILYY